MNKKIRLSVRTLGRHAISKKHWHENGEFRHPRHAPRGFHRQRIFAIRRRENHHLRNALANGMLDDFEPLCREKRDAKRSYIY